MFHHESDGNFCAIIIYLLLWSHFTAVRDALKDLLRFSNDSVNARELKVNNETWRGTA